VHHIRTVLFTVVLVLSWPVQALEIKLKTEIANPVLPSDANSHKTYIKISLTGFNIEQKADRSLANVAIVLDKSGSMDGDKIKRAKQAAKLAVDLMDAKDTVALVSYDSLAKVMLAAKKVTDKTLIKQKIENLSAGGSTALYAGVNKGANQVREFFAKKFVNRVILLSDGLANVGPSSTKELSDLGAKLGSEGISVTTIGLGKGYDEDLMTALAGHSDGNHAFVEKAEDLAKVFEHEFGDVLSVVAQDVTIEIILPDGVKPVRIIGRDGEISKQKVTSKIGQIYANQEKYILLEAEVPAGIDSATRKISDIKINYHNMQHNKSSQLTSEASISYSASRQKIEQAENKHVKSDAIIQTVNEENQRAIYLRDQGKIKEAKKLMQKNVSKLRQNAPMLGSQQEAVLNQLASEYEQDMNSLANDSSWNVQRKSMKSKQYRIKKQQKY